MPKYKVYVTELVYRLVPDIEATDPEMARFAALDIYETLPPNSTELYSCQAVEVTDETLS